MAATNLPTLVFVPGSWHQASCYQKVVEPLQDKHHFKCVPVTLPSTCNNPAATYKEDIDAVREAIFGETTQGRDVVVIAHSYGGMVGNSAIKGFAKKPSPPLAAGAAAATGFTPTTASDADSPSSSGHVIGLILIASGFPLAGLAFMDPFLGHPPPAWRVNKSTGYAELVASPQQFFYHDLPAAEADFWASQLTNQSLKSLFEGGEHTYPGWMDVPSWYIGTVEDEGLPVVAQRVAVGMARGMGGRVEHRELMTSHSPFLSRPGEVVAIMLEAVDAFTGKQVDDPPKGPSTAEVEAAAGGGDGGAAAANKAFSLPLPKARLWQPITWYRFGLPLGLGHVLGRGILIFGWVRGVLTRSR